MEGLKDSQTQLIEFIKTYQQSFYRLANSYVKNPDTALDMVQNAIVKALSNQQTLKNSEYVKTWFYRILVNECLMYLRKNKQVVLVPLEDESLPQLAANEQQGDSIDIHHALDRLDPKLKTVIVLRYFEDLKLEEIATVTNSHLSTVKSRLYKAHKELKTLLE